MASRGKAPGAKVKHLTNHRGQARYWRAVPKDLRGVVGGTAWTKYFPTKISAADMRARVEAMDLQHDLLIAHLRKREKAEPGWLAHVVAQGGLGKLQAEEVWNRDGAEIIRALFADMGDVGTIGLDEIALPPGASPAVISEALAAVAEEVADDGAAEHAKTDRLVRRMEAEAASIRGALGQTDLDETRGLGSLVALMRGRQSQKSLERLQTYLRRFMEYLGADREPSAVKKSDAVGWRDELVKKGVTGVNQAQHLAKVSAAFARAVSKGVVPVNPFAGVKPEYTREEKKVSRKKRAFTPDQLRTLVVAAEAQPGAFSLIIKCLMLTGARSSEICGLRVKDVRPVNGVLCFDITDEGRSVKNAASVRHVPVPSILADEIKALCDGQPGDAPLFKGLPQRKQGPAHKLQMDASKLIRASVSEDRALTLHCLRHTWRQRAGKLKIDEAARRAILGHVQGEDDHDLTYWKRPDADELVEPLELVANSLWRDVIGGSSTPP